MKEIESHQIYSKKNLSEQEKFIRNGSSSGALAGAPKDGFLLNTLKTLFRLSRVLLDL